MTNRHNKNGGWASDEDASNLLAGILDETAGEAEAERQRLDAELQARQARERQEREAEASRKQQEASAKLAQEQNRQQELQRSRTAQMEAIRIDELKAKGEWVDPAIEAEKQRKAEEERQRQAEMDARIRAQVEQEERAKQQQAQVHQMQQVQAEPERSNAPLLILAAVVVLAVGGAIFGVVLAGGYTPDTTTYTVATLEPSDTTAPVADASITPLPKPKPTVEVAVKAKKPGKRVRPKRPRPNRKKCKKGEKFRKGKCRPVLDLRSLGSDPTF